MTPLDVGQSTSSKMTAAEVKAGLRRRHPGDTAGSMVGQWTCIEEWCEIDLLALSAWSDAAVIGYEVKVSRSDLRQELLRPRKRAVAVAMCTEFYFAVPKGLLKPDEIAYDEPEWEPGDFKRMRCPGVPTFGPVDALTRRRHRGGDLLDMPPGRYGGQCHGRGWTGSYKAGTREKGPFHVCMPLPMVGLDPPDYVTTTWKRIEGTKSATGTYKTERVPLTGQELEDELIRWLHSHIWEAERQVRCPACGGKGYIDKSRVEAEAPTLWVPKDVGLVEVDARGSRVVRKSPKRPEAPGLIPDGETVTKGRRQALNKLVRWVSHRPDPRHLPIPTREEAADAA